LENLNITKENIIALGDSPSDKKMFDLSAFSIAVNPKGNIAKYANVVVKDDLSKAVKILEKLSPSNR